MMVYDDSNHRSYTAILDAKNIEQGPLVKLHFDQALPLAFHGNWFGER